MVLDENNWSKSDGIIWDHMGSYGIIMGSYGIIWDHMGSYGIMDHIDILNFSNHQGCLLVTHNLRWQSVLPKIQPHFEGNMPPPQKGTLHNLGHLDYDGLHIQTDFNPVKCANQTQEKSNSFLRSRGIPGPSCHLSTCSPARDCKYQSAQIP